MISDIALVKNRAAVSGLGLPFSGSEVINDDSPSRIPRILPLSSLNEHDALLHASVGLQVAFDRTAESSYAQSRFAVR